MKLSSLIAQRQYLQAQAQLSQVAYAFALLRALQERIDQARLHGRVRLRHCTPEDDGTTAEIAPLDLAPSVLEEFFTDYEIAEWADALSLALSTPNIDVIFSLDSMARRFLPALSQRLTEAGVLIDDAQTRPAEEVWDDTASAPPGAEAE